MSTRTYQVSATTSQANAASVTVIARGWLTGVKWTGYLDSLADNSLAVAEVSFQQISQIGVNGAVGVIDGISQYQNVQAAPVGQSQAGFNQQTQGLRIPVVPGNVIYLNTQLTSGRITAILQVQE
jgi:hypothetical protein